MKNLIAVICMVLLLAPSFLFSQNDQAQFGIFGGVALPQGDFGDDDEEDNGAALTGFCGGIELSMPINSPGLSFVGSATVLFNGMDEGPLKDFIEYESGVEPKSVDVGSWINIPIMAGIKYQSAFSQTNDFYVFGQVGLNIILPPKMEGTVEIFGTDYTGKIDFDSGTSFGFCIGGGVIFNENISLGLRYYILGEPELEGKIKIPGEDDEDIEWEGSVSILALTLGINLN